MAHTVKTLVAGLELPDGNLYPNANTTVILDDAQYALLASNIFTSGKLQDLGASLTPISVGASPFTYTAPYPGVFVLNPSGATISSLQWNGTAIPTTTSILVLSGNDTVAVAYSGGTPLMYIRNQS